MTHFFDIQLLELFLNKNKKLHLKKKNTSVRPSVKWAPFKIRNSLLVVLENEQVWSWLDMLQPGDIR